jgi:hypothetical protein
MATAEAFLVLIRLSKPKGHDISYLSACGGGGLLHRIDQQHGSSDENSGAACIVSAEVSDSICSSYVRNDREKPCLCRYSGMPTFDFRLPEHWLLFFPYSVNVLAVG